MKAGKRSENEAVKMQNKVTKIEQGLGASWETKIAQLRQRTWVE